MDKFYKNVPEELFQAIRTLCLNSRFTFAIMTDFGSLVLSQYNVAKAIIDQFKDEFTLIDNDFMLENRKHSRSQGNLIFSYIYYIFYSDYEHYYEAMMWMPASEKNASGCGTWYYRYACALMYCGKLEKALEYAEKGVTEEPEYPWGWLQLARLRSYFGDETGAFAANDAGLQLVPGDYEFFTAGRRIKKGVFFGHAGISLYRRNQR